MEKQLSMSEWYDILAQLRDIDVNGTRSIPAANAARTKIARGAGITEKDIIRFCKGASKAYKTYGSRIGDMERSGKPVIAAIDEILEETGKQDSRAEFIVGYVFHENEFARNAVRGKNLVKYGKDRRAELFNS